MSTLTLNRRGPYTYLVSSNLTLSEGETYEAGIVYAGGTYEFLIVGGHDGNNRVIPSAIQSAGPPAFQAPAGAIAIDNGSGCVWVSSGWSGGVPANGLDTPTRGMIAANNFLGWTAYVPSSSPSNIDCGTWI